MRGWYCVHTNPREERRALAHISGAGLRAWLPEINVPKRRHGRPVRLLEPLFPRYLFAVMDPVLPSEWQVVRWGRGVRDIVREGVGPLPVSEPVILALYARFGERATEAPSPLIPGVQVRVVDGPMVDLEGLIVEAPTPQSRVRVLMQLLHRELIVEMDAFGLERIS
jgi:transcriptional antiterminator RfaH